VLEDWARPPEPLPAEPAEPPAVPAELLPPPILRLHLPAAAQTSVLVCAPFVGTDAPDHAAGTLAAAVVGAGYSARLNQEVRIRRGLSYGVTGRIEQQRLTGLFIASAQTDHAHAAEVATLMQAQLLALAQQPVGGAELAARRAALLGGLARQLDTTSGLVARIGEDWALGADPVRLARWPAQLEVVSAAQVRAFAQRHWTPERLRTLIAGPALRA
jgi:zinc protease